MVYQKICKYTDRLKYKSDHVNDDPKDKNMFLET